MKAIAIPQPWAQLVVSGCKRFLLAKYFPFEEGETVLIYASDLDPKADEDACFLAPYDRMLLENARVFGYLTEDELPTNAFIGCVQVMHYNVGEDVSGFTCYLPKHLYIGDKKGPVEIQFENPQAFEEPIPFETDHTELFFDAPLAAANLPNPFTFRQFCCFTSKIFAPCSYQFLYDIGDLKEYVYTLNLLPELQREINRMTTALPLIPNSVLAPLIELENRHKVHFATMPHDITFIAGEHRVSFFVKHLTFEPSELDSKTKVAIFHLSKIPDDK